MEKIMLEAIEWLKNSSTEEKQIKGCITGSSLLGYFEDEHQDIDTFVYDKKSFTNLLDKMYYDDMFQLLDPLEKWKFVKEFNEESYKEPWLITIKFMYNLSFPINVIYKKNKDNIFAVLSSFDMNIIAKGYDIQTKQILDLTNGSTKTKIADWNRWNTKFYSPELWEMSRILRQVTRIIKYYKRGYNTDKVALKYIEIINKILEYQNIFVNARKFEDILKTTKTNATLIKKVLEKWLETHQITDKELKKLNQKIKEI